MKRTFAILALFAGAILLFPVPSVGAQAPLLQVSSAQMGMHGWEVTLTNRNSSAATAFAIRMNATGGEHTILGLHSEDSVPNSSPARIILPPGASRTLHMGSANMANVTYSDAAVIYADGTVAGEPAVVQRLLAVRKAAYTELPEVISILGNAASDPGTDQAALLATFRQRRSAHETAMGIGPIRADDRICESVVATLTHASSANFRGHISALRASFQKWYEQLAADPAIAGSASAPGKFD